MTSLLLAYHGPALLHLVRLVAGTWAGRPVAGSSNCSFSSGRAPSGPAPSTAAPGTQSLWIEQLCIKYLLS